MKNTIFCAALCGLLMLGLSAVAGAAEGKKRIMLFGDSNTSGHVETERGDSGRPPLTTAGPGKMGILPGAEHTAGEGLTGRATRIGSPERFGVGVIPGAGMNRAACLPASLSSRMPIVHAAEVTSVQIVRVTIKENQFAAFAKAAKEQMRAALRAEPGVVAMYAVADKNTPSDMIFFIMYREENACGIHRNTPHFQKYLRTAKDMIVHRALTDAVPVDLRDRYNTPAEYENISRQSDVSSVRIAHLQIKKEQLAAFREAVQEEMEAALRVEPGVVAIYAVADKNDPTKMTFFEMYVDENAYRIHRDTPHFQKYFHTTNDMIAARVLLEAVPVALHDKRNSLFEQFRIHGKNPSFPLQTGGNTLAVRGTHGKMSVKRNMP